MDGTLRRGPASFATQANALLRKNLAFQKRNLKTNVGIVAFPLLLCVLLVVIQALVNQELDKPENRCGCACVDTDGDGRCETVCGVQYSSLSQVATCPIPSPPRWPALLQVPRLEYRASRSDLLLSPDGLPNESCRTAQSCPASVLVTAANRSLAQKIEESLFASTFAFNFSDYLDALSNLIPGTDAPTRYVEFLEPAFLSNRPLYVLQSQCPPNVSATIPVQIATVTIQQEIKCVQGLPLWCESSSIINNELYKGYRQGNDEKKINEYIAAYDFLNSNQNNFDVIIWYNSTYNNDTGGVPAALVRVPRSLNLISNAYLKFLRGNGLKMQLEFVKEMPKPATRIRLDFSSLLGPLFFTWIIELLFPVVLTYLVYEKQQKLRIMMKMHGLGDGPYWLISYAYFLVISAFYMICFVIFGSVIGLKFFTLNAYSIQFVFYFLYINLQIALAFLMASIFSDVKAATVIGYIYVFGSGLLGAFLFQFFVEDSSFPRGWVRAMEIVPGFCLFRGLYELSQYSFFGYYMGTSGMQWGDLNDHSNGMKDVLIIMALEFLLLLPFAYYLDQVASLGSGIRKGPLFFLQSFRKKPLQSYQKPSLQHQGSKVSVEMERPDVSREKVMVENLLLEHSSSHAIICDNLKKVYPGRDGNPDKFAVRGLSLALPRGECFGMLGPNGAGKTSFINMMIGLIPPNSGTAYVQGLDIRTNMDVIYSNMGVCPQHDLLWETLTGREHLMFYGRLKNLRGAALLQAVEESLKSVNLFHGGVGDKQVGKYSGGMKRRLSVAISLIGDPKVVYMDEPSTGLDPASRNNLWSVVKHAKEGRAIILTTHSMEEAEVLCDRLGIFVDGSLQCIGNPRELKARYGGSYVFTVTTPSNEEEAVDRLVQQLSPNANKIYHISGTQKFELSKQEVKIADVFRAVEKARSKITISAWGLADTTLEDVFIKVAKGAQTSDVLL